MNDIYDYQAVCDTTNNSPASIAKNELKVDVYANPVSIPGRSLHCPKCLVGGTQIDEAGIGAKCPYPSCDGVIEYRPTWAELTEPLPEKFTCGRRNDTWAGTNIPVCFDQKENEDHWDRFKSNGQRVCSYCGSLHPHDFLDMVHQSAITSEEASCSSSIQISTSDKHYKIYIEQPHVRNAHEGGIKFYTHHLPKGVSQIQQEEFREAVRRSNIRFNKMLKQRYFIIPK